MNAQVKKWINRGGLVLVIIGIVGVTVGGGDTEAVMETAGQAATIIGAAVVFIRELLG